MATGLETEETMSIQAEDVDTACLVARFQAGDRAVFAEIYSRYLGRVHAYLSLLLKDIHEAEDLSQQVFLSIFQALPGYEQRDKPFRAWLFTIVRNHALKHLRKHGRVEVEDANDIRGRRERASTGESELTALGWVTDRDLMLFIDRLPVVQRQLLVLRFMVDLSIPEIAEVLGRTSNEVRVLQHRALTFLRDRLAAVGRDRPGDRPSRMRRRHSQAPVLRYRRFSLLSP